MKRSSCLSALLVGFSVTTASVAFAAPPAAAPSEEAKAKPTLVAQATPPAKPTTKTVQPTDPPPAEGGTAPTPPETAPAEPAPPEAAPAETTQPAISLGGATAPGSDKPATAPEEPKKKPAMRRWAGTQVANYFSTSTATLSPGQQQDFNPTADYSLWLLPRFSISESFQLRGLLVFNYEFTNSDTTQTRNEPRFSDTLLSLWYKKLPEIPGVGIKPAVSLNLGLPSSPESRARTLIMNPGFGVQLFKGFEHVLGGEVALIASASYSHPLYNYTTPGKRDDGAGQAPIACFGATLECSAQLSGTMNPSDTVLYLLIATGEWGKWSPGIFYRGTSQWAYSPKEVSYMGRPIEAPAGFNPTNVRQASYFSFWMDYNWNSWFTTEVGYWMARATVLDEDGTRGSIFFNRYQDMRVYLGLNVNIDNIMKVLEGGPADAGIVRAKANGPVVNW